MSKARQLAQKPTQPTGRKNLIINGAMQVAQRGTSVTGQTGGKFNTVDRLMLEVSGGTYDHEQSTDAPDGFKNSVKVTNIGAFTPTASQYLIPFEFRFERDELAHLAYGTSDAKTVTLSFWIKSNKTGTYTVDFYNSVGSRRWAQSYTIDAANTWEQKTLTWTGDTSQSFGSGTSAGGYFYFWMTAGTNFTSGSLPSDWESPISANRAVGVPTSLADGDAFYLTGAQLEVGSVATEFEHRSFGEELALCQRYFECSYNEGPPSEWTGDHYYDGVHIGNPSTSDSLYITGVPFKVTKRITNPTVTCYSKTGTSGQFTEGATDRTVHSVNVNKDHIVRVRTSVTTSNGGFLIYDADAEL